MNIEIILGCMYSGKSTELLRRVNRWKAIGKKILLINNLSDTRTNNSVKTHSNIYQDACKIDRFLDSDDHEKICEYFCQYDVIGIDEGQFFSDLYDFLIILEKYVYQNSKNINIIISGLDGDWKREPIGDILKIIPLCDDVVKLKALDMISKDGSLGIFSKRINTDTNQISIGGDEKYVAVSRTNYLCKDD